MYMHSCYIPFMQRRAQKPVSIRSDRAAARLALLTRDGRSQAQVIEEALDRLPLPPPQDDLETRRARVMAILERIDPADIPTMAEFDAREYDERGNPR
jgi:antitoxin VapB